jgi:tetratricopeptide (TPR) repeat protein
MAEVFRHNQLDLYGLASLALRISEILEDPERSECGAVELFGISRMLQRRGDSSSAERIYKRALDEGLPEAAKHVAQRELAFLAKRGRNYEVSNALWEKLLDDSIEAFKAYEQLAIYYEHHASLPQKATDLSREALARLQEEYRAGRMPSQKYQQWHASFQHRLSRLTAKTAK